MDSEDIKNLNTPSLSQKDRVSLKDNVRDNMLLFLHTKLQRAISGSELKQKLETKINEFVDDENNPITFREVLDAYKIIADMASRSEGKLLDLLNSKEKANDGELEVRGKEETVLSTEDMKEAQKMLSALGSSNVKKFMNMLGGLKESEFSEEESKDE